MNKRILKLGVGVIVLFVVALSAFFIVKHRTTGHQNSEAVYASMIKDIKELIRVTTLEGDRMIPVTLEDKGVGAFALGSYKVRISYNVEALETYQLGDTLLVRLPREEVTILENDRVGFRVIDVWGTTVWSRLRGVTLTLEQENRMREIAKSRLRKDLQRDGSIQEARNNAIHAVSDMLSVVPGTVIVLEPAATRPGLPPATVRRLGTEVFEKEPSKQF